MSYYVQSVYLAQSISIMNLSSLPIKTCGHLNHACTQLSNCNCNKIMEFYVNYCDNIKKTITYQN